MIDKKHCSGCYNDWYNYNKGFNDSPGCWSRKNAKLVSRVLVHIDAMPPYSRKTKKVPSCWRGQRTVAYPKERFNKAGYIV